jgi:hypothetical protein
MSRRLFLLCLIASLAPGCKPTSKAPGATGAGTVARAWFRALLRRDWGDAYSSLHPDGQSRWTSEQFARLAANYRASIGFEPKEVHLRSCEEQGSQAVARAVFQGSLAGRKRYHKDAVTLSRGEAGWGVVLPLRFGQTRRPARP